MSSSCCPESEYSSPTVEGQALSHLLLVQLSLLTSPKPTYIPIFLSLSQASCLFPSWLFRWSSYLLPLPLFSQPCASFVNLIIICYFLVFSLPILRLSSSVESKFLCSPFYLQHPKSYLTSRWWNLPKVLGLPNGRIRTQLVFFQSLPSRAPHRTAS